MTTIKPREPEGAPGDITLNNRLQAEHRYHASLDRIVRLALGDLAGPWEVSAYPVGRAWFRIEVVAPDGASWSMSVPVNEGPQPQDLADTVRAACARRLQATGGERRARPKPRGAPE